MYPAFANLVKFFTVGLVLLGAFCDLILPIVRQLVMARLCG